MERLSHLMTEGGRLRRPRNLRVAIAALMAGLFCLVAVAHAGAHMGAQSGASVELRSHVDGGIASCAICQNTGTEAGTPHHASPSLAVSDHAPSFAAPILCAKLARAHASRGPPAA